MARPNTARARILDAAVDLAAEQGVSATTTDAIAERAGVAKGSVYYNFASKDELYATAFSELGDRLAVEMRAARDAAVELDPDGDEAPIDFVVRRLAGILMARPTASKFFTGELLRTDRIWAESVLEVRAVLLEVFRDAIAASAPDLGAEVDLDTAAVGLLGAVLLAAFDSTAIRKVRSPDALVRTFVALRRRAR